MKRFILPLAAIIASFGLATASEAATASGNLSVGASVVPTCSVTATAVDFGAVPVGSSAAYSNGDITVTCSSGVPYNIALNEGLNFAVPERHMSGGPGSPISYRLYKDSASLSPWGYSDFAGPSGLGSSLADVGTGSAQPHTVYGTLLSTGMYSATYSDIVTVTVHY